MTTGRALIQHIVAIKRKVRNVRTAGCGTIKNENCAEVQIVLGESLVVLVRLAKHFL